MNLLNILLQAQQGNSWSGMLLILAMIVVFYFFMIREALKSGDKIVTAGGIHGRIKDISETTMNVEIAPNVSIKIDKGSVYPLGEEGTAKK